MRASYFESRERLARQMNGRWNNWSVWSRARDILSFTTDEFFTAYYIDVCDERIGDKAITWRGRKMNRIGETARQRRIWKPDETSVRISNCELSDFARWIYLEMLHHVNRNRQRSSTFSRLILFPLEAWKDFCLRSPKDNCPFLRFGTIALSRRAQVRRRRNFEDTSCAVQLRITARYITHARSQIVSHFVSLVRLLIGNCVYAVGSG